MSGDGEGGLGDALLAVGRGDHVVATGLEPEPQGPQERGVVVDDEHLRHPEVPVGARTGDRQGEDEAGAASGHVLDPDRLAVRLDERLGDGQPEPGPAPGVEADEAIEDGLPFSRRHARPRSVTETATRSPRTSAATVIGVHRRRVSVGVVQEVERGPGR